MKTDLIPLLEDLLSFLDSYVDINDGPYGDPIPNSAMHLHTRVEDLLDELIDQVGEQD